MPPLLPFSNQWITNSQSLDTWDVKNNDYHDAIVLQCSKSDSEEADVSITLLIRELRPDNKPQFESPAAEEPTKQRRIVRSLHRSVLRICYVSVFSLLAFGVLSSVIDNAIRRSMQIDSLSKLTFRTRAFHHFASNFITGFMYFPTASIIEPVLTLFFSFLGRMSNFAQVKPGYLPLFWAEDVPEVLGFSVSAALMEFSGLQVFFLKACMRSAFGSVIGACIGEIYRYCSSSFQEENERPHSRITKSYPPKRYDTNNHHKYLSMGFLLGSVSFLKFLLDDSICHDLAKECSKDRRATIQAVYFFGVMIAYEIGKRIPCQPSLSLARMFSRAQFKNERENQQEYKNLYESETNITLLLHCGRRRYRSRNIQLQRANLYQRKVPLVSSPYSGAIWSLHCSPTIYAVLKSLYEDQSIAVEILNVRIAQKSGVMNSIFNKFHHLDLKVISASFIGARNIRDIEESADS